MHDHDAELAYAAGTDQALAWLRDKRTAIARTETGRLSLLLADAMAAEIRLQFPDIPTGRIMLAAVNAMDNASQRIRNAYGRSLPADTLLGLAALAAEQLTREDQDIP